MWAYIRPLFVAPEFEDEEQTRLASMLNVILWVLIFALAIFMVMILVLAPEPWSLVGIFAIYYVPITLAMVVMRRGRVSLAILIFVVSMWLGIALTDLLRPSQNGNLTSYIIAIVTAGLLLKGRGALAFTVLTILVKLIAIPVHQIIAPEQVGLGLPGVLATAVTLGIVTVLIHIASSNIDNALERARRNEQALSEKVTELRQLSEELAVARDEALAASKAKSEFLANVSHEIRTPLNAVVGMTELLLDSSLDEQQLDFVETIRQSSDALLRLIDDILDLSKIEAERLELEAVRFDLRACIESAMDLVATRAGEKGLELAYLIEPDTPTQLIGDSGRLRQIIINLLGNGVKFTEEGEVVLTVSSQPLARGPAVTSEHGWHEWLFTVRDTGIGIAEKDLNRLFESFTQVDASTTRQYGGTGLGLAISRRLVEMMHGRIWVESKLGQGSSFHFTVRAPAIEERPAEELARQHSNLQGKRILVVDDNATNRKIIRLQAQAWGMEVREASSGAQALAYLERDEPLDLVILDMSMPQMDGLALAEQIRALRDKHSLPMIMLTSIGLRQFDSRLAHFAAFLTKPIKAAALYDVLLGVLSPDARPEQMSRTFDAQAATGVFDETIAQRHPLHILLVEDNELNRKMTLLMLERLGYKADVAVNGKEAVDAVRERQYDVVLMDIQMPVMDGLAATRRIRRRPQGLQPYIIALTADVVENARERSLAAGVDDFVSKPVTVADLVMALRKAAEAEPVSPTGQRPERARPPVAPPSSSRRPEVLDVSAFDRIYEMLGPNAPEMLPILASDFNRDSEGLFAEMEAALALGKAQDLRRAAHSLKSNSAHFGMSQLSELARAIEMQARAGELDGIEDKIATTRAAFEAAARALDEQVRNQTTLKER